jgi:hypothetical protein
MVALGIWTGNHFRVLKAILKISRILAGLSGRYSLSVRTVGRMEVSIGLLDNVFTAFFVSFPMAPILS